MWTDKLNNFFLIHIYVFLMKPFASSVCSFIIAGLPMIMSKSFVNVRCGRTVSNLFRNEYFGFESCQWILSEWDLIIPSLHHCNLVLKLYSKYKHYVKRIAKNLIIVPFLEAPLACNFSDLLIRKLVEIVEYRYFPSKLFHQFKCGLLHFS